MSSQGVFTKLTAIIVDDEFYGRENLKTIIENYCYEIEILGCADSVVCAKGLVNSLGPDVVFLDINMPVLDGFDFLEEYNDRNFMVVFVSAHEEFGISAVKVRAADYLLKPVNPEQLAVAIDKASLLIRDHFNMQMDALYENLRSVSRQDKKIILKTTEQIHLLDLKSIVSCESDSCYTTVHTMEGEHIMVAKTLKEYEEMLSGCGFYRVHKSFLINLAHIKRFDKQDGGYIVLTNDLKIPVASRKREEMLELLEKMAE